MECGTAIRWKSVEWKHCDLMVESAERKSQQQRAGIKFGEPTQQSTFGVLGEIRGLGEEPGIGLVLEPQLVHRNWCR